MSASPSAPFAPTHAPARFESGASRAEREAAVFDRMFRRRRGAALDDDVLVALAATMDEGMSLDEPPARVDSARMAAGYTYLGQFIDHDLTADRRRFATTRSPSISVPNFRTPRFDLDCLYGDGPEDDSDLYVSPKLSVDRHDFKRRPDTGRAHIKDPRNDSNRIVSQLHLAFAHFHNRVVDALGSGPESTASERLARARKVVCRHYQWIVLHDFLPRTVGPRLVESILGRDGTAIEERLKLFKPSEQPKMPFEFSAAAFRYGHSMVRSAYELNSSSGQVLTFDRMQPEGHQADDLRGFRPMPEALAIDWGHFFPIPGNDPARLQMARPIDTLIAGPLFELPISVALNDSAKGRMLPYRNLHRSEFDLGLLTGQEVVEEMRRLEVAGADGISVLGVDTELVIDSGQGVDEGDLAGTHITKKQLEERIGPATPLWYYMLKEASQLHHGERLGPVGGQLVAEVCISLMMSDSNSLLRLEEPWQPKQGEFGCKGTGEYAMADLLEFARTGAD